MMEKEEKTNASIHGDILNPVTASVEKNEPGNDLPVPTTEIPLRNSAVDPFMYPHAHRKEVHGYLGL